MWAGWDMTESIVNGVEETSEACRERQGLWGKGGDLQTDWKAGNITETTSSYTCTNSSLQLRGWNRMGNGKPSGRYEGSEKESMAGQYLGRDKVWREKQPYKGGSPGMGYICLASPSLAMALRRCWLILTGCRRSRWRGGLRAGYHFCAATELVFWNHQSNGHG